MPLNGKSDKWQAHMGHIEIGKARRPLMAFVMVRHKIQATTLNTVL